MPSKTVLSVVKQLVGVATATVAVLAPPTVDLSMRMSLFGLGCWLSGWGTPRVGSEPKPRALKQRLRDLGTGALIMLSACAPGCASTPELNDARSALAEIGNGLARSRAALLAICDERPPLPPLSPATRVRCDEAIAGFEVIRQGYAVARKAVP